MSDRVNAIITIGGRVPADRLEDLIVAIEEDALGPDWDVTFLTRDEVVAHLQDGAVGVSLYAREVASGELPSVQELCVEVGLSYVLTHGGYGCEWGPARRIRRPGDEGDGVTCSLDADWGAACVTKGDILRLEFTDIQAVLAHLALFDDPHVPPLEIEGAGSS